MKLNKNEIKLAEQYIDSIIFLFRSNFRLFNFGYWNIPFQIIIEICFS